MPSAAVRPSVRVDGLVMDPGDTRLPVAVEPTTAHLGAERSTRTLASAPPCRPASASPTRSPEPRRHRPHHRGRAWNVVTSSAGKAALNFTAKAHMEHDLRYEVAQEFVDVVKASGTAGRTARSCGQGPEFYIDPSKVRPARPSRPVLSR